MSDVPPVRGAMAIISNSMTPYRLYVHEQIVARLPQIKLYSVVTHGGTGGRWALREQPHIRLTDFGHGESTMRQRKLRHIPSEWRKGGRIIQWLKQQRIDAVVCQGYRDAGRIRIMRWCRRRHIPCLLTGDANIRGDTARGAKAWLKKLLVSRVITWVDGVMPCGSMGRAYFEKYGADPQRIYDYPLIPDFESIESLAAEKIDQARLKFGLRQGRRRIVYSGRLVHFKRVDLIIDAFIAIAADRPDWDLVILGDGDLRRSLQQRVPGPGPGAGPGAGALRDRVIWAGFIDDQEMVSALYRVCDVLVLPSDYEPWALVILEALAAGAAVIASDVVGAAVDLIEEGVNGSIFPAGNLQALTDKLRYVTDEKHIDTLKAKSRQTLTTWRTRHDPVRGLQQALQSVGMLEPHDSPKRFV